MSARPHFRVLVRARWKFSGATHCWLVDSDGAVVPVWLFGRTSDGFPMLRLREPLR